MPLVTPGLSPTRLPLLPSIAHGLPFVECRGRIYPHIPSPVKKRDLDDERLLLLHSGQRDIYRSKARFRCVVAGRRYGKTHLICIELLRAATVARRQRCWYVAPSYAMAKQIAWEKLKEIVPYNWLAKKPNETELKLTLKNGSTITLKGADNPDSTRGVGVHFLALDEYQDMKASLWEAIRPTLSDTKGRCIFIGTPKSFNHLYEMYRRGQPNTDGKKNPQWESWQFRTSDSPFISRFEIEQAKRDMDVRSFRQEYEASFESMSGRVYYDFDRRLNVRPCPFDPSIPTLIGQDFNIDPMSGIALQRHGDEVWATGEMILRSSSTEDVCRELLREYGEDFKNTATVYPDPAGNTRQHARGESDVQIFREWGFNRILFRKKAPSVRDRIASVNRLINDATGERRLFIDPSCKQLIQCFEQLIFKEGTNDPDKSLNIEHVGDAIGYPIEFEFPVKRKQLLMGYSR